jgi:S1-C subfamily serine protease
MKYSLFIIFTVVVLYASAQDKKANAAKQVPQKKSVIKATYGPVADHKMMMAIPDAAPAAGTVNNKINVDADNQFQYVQDQIGDIKGVTAPVVLPLKTITETLIMPEQVPFQENWKMKEIQTNATKAIDWVNKLAFAAGVSRSELEFRKGMISGPSQFDSRIEPVMLDSMVSWQNGILKNTESVGMVIEKDKIHAIADGWVQLDISSSLQSRYKLCSEEPFSNQPVIGTGTAFIVGPKRLVTASHVLSGAPENYVVIFGFQMINKNGVFRTLISTSNIYYPNKLVHQDSDSDLTVFEVSEELRRPPLKLLPKTAQTALNSEIYMIGHPTGMPQKVALNADIQEVQSHFFYTSLDAFQGNSGSPVFNWRTHEVIGILVSGEIDYIWNGTCNKTSLCRFPYCKGEKVMKISLIHDYLQ